MISVFGFTCYKQEKVSQTAKFHPFKLETVNFIGVKSFFLRCGDNVCLVLLNGSKHIILFVKLVFY